MSAAPNSFLQENLLTLLCYDDVNGAVLLSLVTPELFEGDYREIAERVFRYWSKHRSAPKKHTVDLMADVIGSKNDRRARVIEQMLIAMDATHLEVNAKYVVDSAKSFVRVQRMKSVIINSATKLERLNELAIPEVEKLWQEMMHADSTGVDLGLRLTQYNRALEHMTKRSREFTTGIRELDEGFIVPARGESFLMIAASGKGKSWWLSNLGVQATLGRKKVLHVSLELSAEEIMLRYYQSIFGASKRQTETWMTEMETSERKGRRYLEALEQKKVKAEFTLTSPSTQDELRTRIDWYEGRYNNVIVKRFPMRSLTVEKLANYLDQLERIEKFVPDLLILDYIGIMHTDPRNHRIHLGRNYEGFVGLCVERNIAGATAQQGSREGEKAHTMKRSHVSEDWSLIGSSDNVILYSQSEAEERFGLARLNVEKARYEQGNLSLFISQNYAMGQFCVASVPYTDDVREIADDLTESDDDSGTDEALEEGDEID